MARDYKKEYANYQGTPAQIKRRSSRNKARRMMEKKGLARKGDGKDVDHKNNNPMDDLFRNLHVTTQNYNRSYPRTATARKKT